MVSRAAASVLASSVAWRMLMRSDEGDRPRQRPGPNLDVEPPPLLGLEKLGVAEPGRLPVGRQDHGRGGHGAGQTATPDFVDAGDVTEAAAPQDLFLSEVRIESLPVPAVDFEPATRSPRPINSWTPARR
jgi:hypothetical protein